MLLHFFLFIEKRFKFKYKTNCWRSCRAVGRFAFFLFAVFVEITNKLHNFMSNGSKWNEENKRRHHWLGGVTVTVSCHMLYERHLHKYTETQAHIEFYAFFKEFDSDYRSINVKHFVRSAVFIFIIYSHSLSRIKSHWFNWSWFVVFDLLIISYHENKIQLNTIY